MTVERPNILEGDAREWIKKVSPPALVLTDPPYGVALRNKHGTAPGDRKNPARQRALLNDQSQAVGQEVLDYCAEQGWPTIAFADPRRPWAGKWDQHLVWDKGGGVGGGGDVGSRWKATWELIQVARLGKLNGGRESAVLRCAPTRVDFQWHPCAKPVALLRYLIAKATQPGELVVDPFAGAGPTLVAAWGEGRWGLGVELDPRFVGAARERLGLLA